MNVGVFTAFGGHSKLRSILPLPPLGRPHHIFMHLLHAPRKRCFRRLFYRSFTKAFHETATCTLADWVVLLHEKLLEMINRCSQWEGQRRRIFFKSHIRNCINCLSNRYLYIFFFRVLCSYNKFYFCPKFMFALSEIAKRRSESFNVRSILSESFESESFWFYCIYHRYSF